MTNQYELIGTFGGIVLIYTIIGWCALLMLSTATRQNHLEGKTDVETFWRTATWPIYIYKAIKNGI